MPQQPQVLSEGGGVGATPSTKIPLSFGDQSGLEHFGKGLQAAGEGIQQAQYQYARARAVLANEAYKSEAELAMVELGRQAADSDIRLKQDPTVTPETYTRRRDDDLRAAQTGISNSMTTPESRSLFHRAATKFVGAKSIEGKYEALGLWKANVEASADSLLVEDVNNAVRAKAAVHLPEAERNALYEDNVNRGLARIQNLVNLRLPGMEHKRLKFLATIEEAGLRQDYDDPALRTTVLNRLAAKGYMNLDPLYQARLATELVDRTTHLQRTQEASVDRDMKHNANVFVNQFFDSYADPSKPDQRMDRDTARRGIEKYAGYVTPETQRAIYDTANKPELEGGITNPEVYNKLVIQIRLNPAGTSPEWVLREPPTQLSAKDKGVLLQMIKTGSKDDDISQHPLYKKGREQIIILLGGVSTGIPEFLAMPILKPAESANLARVLDAFDKKARTEEYLRSPEKLGQLGRDMALAGRGQVGAPPSPAPAPETKAPKVELPKGAPPEKKGGRLR